MFTSLRVELAESRWENGKSNRKVLLNLGTLRVKENLIDKKSAVKFLVSVPSKLDFNHYDPQLTINALATIQRKGYEIENFQWVLKRSALIKKLKNLFKASVFHGAYFYPVRTLMLIRRDKRKRNADWRSKNPGWQEKEKVLLYDSGQKDLSSEVLLKKFKNQPRWLYKTLSMLNGKTRDDLLRLWRNDPAIRNDFPDLEREIIGLQNLN